MPDDQAAPERRGLDLSLGECPPMSRPAATASSISAYRNARRAALLTGVSVAALFFSDPVAIARPLGGQAPTPSAAAIAAAQSAQQEAARAASQSSDALKRATLAIQAQQASQQSARDAARAAVNASSIPNGLGVGGLQRPAGAVPGTDLWQGANLPTQFTDGDRVKVNIGQTQQKAILTWDTFNVGARTDLRFEQHGNRDWVALNRVLGTDARPSQILGNIKADGSVYVINQNGIIFGGGSQINVGALIASTAKMSDEQFLKGIYSTQTGSTWTPSFTDAAALLGNGTGGGVVKVEAGAQIETRAPASVTSGGGFVLLMGGQVVNAGSIATPLGQAQLAAGDDFVLRRGYGTDQNVASTTRGSEIAPVLHTGGLVGLVRNDGVVFSAQGDITLAGRTIEQNGALVASTSVNTRGTIHLLNSATDTRGSVTLGAGSVTTVIPELESGETALNGQRDALITASATANQQRGQSATGRFDNLSLLADRLDQSRIEIVTGGNVIFKGGEGAGSLTMAQGGQVAVSAGGRIFTESGATIDVSGVRNVSLAMSANNIMVNIQGNELRDSPQNRDSNALKNADVWVDIRDLTYVPSGTGGYEGDRYYTPGGLLEVGGHLANIRHRIGEWSAVGGTITLSAPAVIAQARSVFDISGGSIRYEAGYIRTTNFLGADGRLYNINDARADMTFYGLGSGFIRKHERWNVTEVWTSPFGRGRESVRWEEGYTVGRDAGRLILSTPTAVFEGDILADVVTGERQQQARPEGITDGYKAAQNTIAQAGSLVLGRYDLTAGNNGPYAVDVRIGDVADVTGNLTSDAALSGERTGTAWFDADRLNEVRLGGLTLETRGKIAIESDLTLADGGVLTLAAPTTDIAADVTARSGSIRATNWFAIHPNSAAVPGELFDADGAASITLREGAMLDVRGLWVNAVVEPADTDKLAHIDGGDVFLATSANVTMEKGSRIDVSSGAALKETNKTVGGAGGDVILASGAPQNGPVGSNSTLKLDGDIAGYGVKGGGTLQIETAMAVAIGGGSSQGLSLATDLFQSGFSKYDITGYGGVKVAEGAALDVFAPVYRVKDGGFGVPSAADTSSALEIWTPPLWQENAVKGVLTQRAGASLKLGSGGPYVAVKAPVEISEGAVVTVDPGQKIELSGGGQITINGRLNAYGGRIAITDLSLPGYDGTAKPTSVWIGDRAVLDVAGRAYVARDGKDRRYGVVQDGGSIEIGGAIDWEDVKTNTNRPSDRFLIIRPGAVLDASGASAVLDIPESGLGAAGQPVAVAGDGGSIVLRSANGLYLDGFMHAAAGGEGASGGTLGIAFTGSEWRNGMPVDPALLNPRVITLAQTQGESVLSPGLAAGAADAGLTYGFARLGKDRIEAGGFDHLSLAGTVFAEGDLSLALRGSFRLFGGLALAGSAPDRAAVAISAPYVRLAQTYYPTLFSGANIIKPTPAPTAARPGARLAVDADLIDIGGNVFLSSFGETALTSRGDIRLLNGYNADVNAGNWPTQLVVPGNLTLTAAQIYPATGATARIMAGAIPISAGSVTDVKITDPNGRLTIRSIGGATPDVPYSVFGTLMLGAAYIDQGGVVRAPHGSLQIGTTSFTAAQGIQSQVTFLPGSLTSVSAAGLTMPYGGTLDGIVYRYNGVEVQPDGISPRGSGDEPKRGISLYGVAVDVREGATLDLSGGGDLTGAGFVSGRGGSVDVLRAAFADANPAYGFSRSGNAVYAIVPGFAGGYAPVAADAGAGNPGIGRQVTIPAGIPGLPAGTYTLLPSTYALLPGAFRVEIGAGNQMGLAGVTGIGNGSYVAAGLMGTANTGVRDTLASQIIITPATSVRTHSSYNEKSYNDFVLADAARRGIARGMMTVDAKTLALMPSAGAGLGDTPALKFDGKALFAPQAGSVGFGGTLAVGITSNRPIEILADGQKPAGTDKNGVALYASDLSGFGASRLSIGGVPVVSYGGTQVGFIGPANSVIVRSGAVLSAPEVFLIAAGSDARPGEGRIVVEQGASITTIGRGAPSYDSSDGFIFGGGNMSMLAVSNGWINLLAPTQPGSVPVDIGGCITVCSRRNHALYRRHHRRFHRQGLHARRQSSLWRAQSGAGGLGGQSRLQRKAGRCPRRGPAPAGHDAQSGCAGGPAQGQHRHRHARA
ncbi:hypothetical protein CWO89_10660 [Bradyrhizobium sp. Leo170]|nr:hypothetical protein CWO89_10660 [Bradyrhizobium sp. Leo170]